MTAHPTPPPPHAFHRAAIGTQRAANRALQVAGALGAGLLALLALAFVAGEAGPIALLIGLFAALMPAPVYLALALRIDRYEPEPVGMLLGAFAWGATAAVVIALVVNTAVGLMVGASFGPQTGELWATSVSAPIVEEIAKACVLLAVYLWRRHELNGVLDGLVYAGMVALGFATMENVLYYARAAAGGELGTVFVVRGVLSPFAHPIFTGMTGIGFALAVRARHRATRIVAPVLGLLLAISLHSLWNTSATLAGGLGLLLVYPLIFLPILVALIVTAALVRRRELRMIGRHLQHDVETGLLPAHELAVLCSAPLRRQALRAAKRVGAKRLRKQFHVTATELAFLRDQAIADRFVDAASAAEQDAAYQRNLQAQQLELATRAARRPSPDLPPTSAPQGWYADPWGQARMRWWDGRAWTGHVASPG